MSLQQLPECRFDHGTGEMLDRCSKHDSQLAIPMLKSNFFDLLCIEEGLKANNLWMTVIRLLFCAEQEGSGAICANRIADNRLECVIDVVASGADLDSQPDGPGLLEQNLSHAARWESRLHSQDR